MLLTYGVENFDCIGEKQYVDFSASAKNEFRDTLHDINDSVSVNSGLCMVGPNGAGKSSLLKSLYFLRVLVRDGDNIDAIKPFILSKKWLTKPTTFEALFYSSDLDVFLDYRIVISKSAVEEEHLIARNNKKGAKNRVIFNRSSDVVTLGSGIDVSEDMINATIDSGASLIKFAKGIKIDELKEIYELFDSVILFTPQMIAEVGVDLVRSGFGCNRISKNDSEPTSKSEIERQNKRLEICRNIIKSFGVPLKRLFLVKVNDRLEIFLEHDSLDSDSQAISLSEAEYFYSNGSFNIILIVMIIMGTNSRGNILLLDELDGTFHHKVTIALINLMRSLSKALHSQFVISTHDIMVMDYDFRRDAILTVSKNSDFETRVVKVSDFSVRKDSKLSLKYFADEFGALPSIISGE
ncbi:TPA: AAA family ATPase [Vibrio parahaemolyticus]|nr:AAA family ATPase [Vibrio parahaemolyticus]HCM1501782.1 AAA family ATPase [Vibrio parahaemolyticus]